MNPFAIPEDAKPRPKKGKKADGMGYWAKGTGYGHHDGVNVSWDIEAWKTAQREKDRWGGGGGVGGPSSQSPTTPSRLPPHGLPEPRAKLTQQPSVP